MVPTPPKINKKKASDAHESQKNVLAKKPEANNQKLGAQTRNQKGYVFGFRVSGLGFEV